MKILQLGKFYDPVVGGMETALKDICEGLSDQVEFQIVVANTRWRTEHENGKLRVTRVASMGKCLSLPVAPSFPFWTQRFDADLIHVHLANPLAELSALLANRDIPVVAHFHSNVVRPLPPLLRSVYGRFLHAFYRRANCIVVPSPNHIGISKFVPKYRHKCRVVPYGIRMGRFEMDKTGYRKVDELRDGRPTVLFVGRLVYYKGVEFLVRAMADTNAHLRIVGTGPVENSLKDLARAIGIADRVEFLGQVSEPDLIAHYHACDVFALPSITTQEMFGLVQLEAMACRKPVISTNLPTGVPWVNQHGKTGYTVAPGNSKELAASIQLLLSSRERREDMGEAGRLRVEQHFTSIKMAEAMLQVYQEAVGEAYRKVETLQEPEPQINQAY